MGVSFFSFSFFNKFIFYINIFLVDLLITHFSEAVIPPPLCAYKLHCDFGINNVIWSPYNLDLIVHLMNNEFVYYKYHTSI